MSLQNIEFMNRDPMHTSSPYSVFNEIIRGEYKKAQEKYARQRLYREILRKNTDYIFCQSPPEEKEMYKKSQFNGSFCTFLISFYDLGVFLNVFVYVNMFGMKYTGHKNMLGVPIHRFIIMNSLMFFVINQQFKKRDEVCDKYFAHLSNHHLENFEYYMSMKRPNLYKLYL